MSNPTYLKYENFNGGTIQNFDSESSGGNGDGILTLKEIEEGLKTVMPALTPQQRTEYALEFTGGAASVSIDDIKGSPELAAEWNQVTAAKMAEYNQTLYDQSSLYFTGDKTSTPLGDMMFENSDGIWVVGKSDFLSLGDKMINGEHLPDGHLEKTFEKADTDGDGFLSAAELNAWNTWDLPPLLEGKIALDDNGEAILDSEGFYMSAEDPTARVKFNGEEVQAISVNYSIQFTADINKVKGGSEEDDMLSQLKAAIEKMMAAIDKMILGMENLQSLGGFAGI